MRKITLLTVAIIILALGALAVSVAGAQETDEPVASEGVSLTIYNQGTALVQDRRTFALQSGLNTLDFTTLPPALTRPP
jgi:hypothetical protein